MILINIFLLLALVRYLQTSDNFVVAAAIYAITISLTRAIFGGDIPTVLISALLSFVIALLWFWLLVKFNESSLYWLILIGGLVFIFI